MACLTKWRSSALPLVVGQHRRAASADNPVGVSRVAAPPQRCGDDMAVERRYPVRLSSDGCGLRTSGFVRGPRLRPGALPCAARCVDIVANAGASTALARRARPMMSGPRRVQWSPPSLILVAPSVITRHETTAGTCARRGARRELAARLTSRTVERRLVANSR
jgi:hypothetical protein